ncbi:uncharacterized protein Dwil_GK28256 [Drosophila willistoni]|uniref:Molybdopterin synthase sulfur carrier subunit n=1 Tax=Drosophila willistoni TaxID=7260 RepID=A0A0Q9WUW2_DROWI|nr:molybdopterin synthase sulfur carrier subunit [Drosophila willistoni]KRF99930.1 uncharacterized protein Dwil_GK28256 [Drosophila willistoni]
MSVDVHVLLFAKCRELAKTSTATINVPSEILASELLEKLVEKFDLTSIKDNIILALNEVYIENLNDRIVLKKGDEIAIIPPISGG